MEESRSRKIESGLPSSSSTAEQSSTDIQESRDQLSNFLSQRCIQLIKKARERITSAQTASTIAYASSILSSSIPIFSFISTMKTSSKISNELSSLFEDMNLKVVKGTTYGQPSDEKSSIHTLHGEAMNSLNEIERIILKEYCKNEKAVANTKELCMVMVFLHSIFFMMEFANSNGVHERRAFVERLLLDRYIQEVQNKLESFNHSFADGDPSTVDVEEFMKGNPAFLQEVLSCSKKYAVSRDSAYVQKLKTYFKEEDAIKQYNKFINEDKAKTKSGSRSRKLSLGEMENERKIAMYGVKRRLEELKNDVDDESSDAVNMVSFYDVIISSFLEILSYIIKIPSMPQEQASNEDMKHELTKLFAKLRQNLATAIKNTASTSDSRSHPGRRLKERIRANIKNMELGIRNNVVNSEKIEEEKCLMVLNSIANVFLPTIEWTVTYARNYDGSGHTFDLLQNLRDKEEELKEIFENLIMKA